MRLRSSSLATHPAACLGLCNTAKLALSRCARSSRLVSPAVYEATHPLLAFHCCMSFSLRERAEHRHCEDLEIFDELAERICELVHPPSQRRV